MNTDRSHVFEEFKRGARPLFIVRKKGVPFSEVTWQDIAVQKWQGGIRMMFWEQAAQAEASLVKSGHSHDFEVHLITLKELWLVATRIWGPQAGHQFPYFLSE